MAQDNMVDKLTQTHIGPHHNVPRRAINESVLQQKGLGTLIAYAMHCEDVSILGGHMMHFRLIAVFGN